MFKYKPCTCISTFFILMVSNYTFEFKSVWFDTFDGLGLQLAKEASNIRNSCYITGKWCFQMFWKMWECQQRSTGPCMDLVSWLPVCTTIRLFNKEKRNLCLCHVCERWLVGAEVILRWEQTEKNKTKTWEEWDEGSGERLAWETNWLYSSFIPNNSRLLNED